MYLYMCNKALCVISKKGTIHIFIIIIIINDPLYQKFFGGGIYHNDIFPASNTLDTWSTIVITTRVVECSNCLLKSRLCSSRNSYKWMKTIFRIQRNWSIILRMLLISGFKYIWSTLAILNFYGKMHNSSDVLINIVKELIYYFTID